MVAALAPQPKSPHRLEPGNTNCPPANGPIGSADNRVTRVFWSKPGTADWVSRRFPFVSTATKSPSCPADAMISFVDPSFAILLTVPFSLLTKKWPAKGVPSAPKTTPSGFALDIGKPWMVLGVRSNWYISLLFSDAATSLVPSHDHAKPSNPAALVTPRSTKGWMVGWGLGP